MSAENSDSAQTAGGEKSGYCVTPERTRWKKGAPSPNPRGRPPKPKTPALTIDAASRALIPITRNGRVIKVTRFEAIVVKLYACALKGDRKAQAELARMCLKYARAEQKTLDDDDVEYEFVSRVHGEEKEEEPKKKRERKPRSTIRSRKNETRRETFSRVSALTVNVKDNGVPRRMTYEQALWHVITAAALAEDIAATRLITRYMDEIAELQSRKPWFGDDEVMDFTLDIGKLPALDDKDDD